jgi:Tfp pilus assembly protein PilN
MSEKTISEKRMSFLPEDYVERRIERRTSLICLAMFVVMLSGVGAVYAFKTSQFAEARAQRNSINGRYAEAGRRLEQLEALKARRNEMLRKAQVTATLLERVPRTFLLADLVNRMPDALSLLELHLSSKMVQAPRPAASKSALSNRKDARKEEEKTKEPDPVPQQVVSLALIGVAPTDVQVAQYIAKLTQSPLLTDVSLIFSEETKINETPMRKFRIEMALSPTADVRALEPLPGPGDKPPVQPATR